MNRSRSGYATITSMSEQVNVWRSITRHPVLAVLPLIVLVAAGVGWGLSRHPVYTATTRLYVQVPTSDPSALFSLTDAASGLASAYSRAVDATDVVKAVARDLATDPAAVAGRTSATPVPNSPVVKVIAEASSSTGAVRLANATAAELRKYIQTLNDSDAAARSALSDFSEATRRVARAESRVRDLERTLATTQSTVAQQELDDARADLEVAQLRRDSAKARFSALQTGQQPSLELLRGATGATNDRHSKLELFGFLGLLAGGVGGAALATLATALDPRPRSGEEVAGELGLPLLAKLPEPSRRVTKNMRLVMLERPDGRDAEALRVLRANVAFAIAEDNVQVIMFVSAVGTEGKSATAANLGVALARLGERVVVVDLDLRKPRLARYFKLEGDPGVSDVVFGRTTVGTAIAHLPLSGATNNGRSGQTLDASRNGHGIDVLPAGTPPPNPGEFVGSPELRELFAELRREYDVILVDTPPALAVGDAMALSSVADALLVVARPASLSRPQVRALHRILDACPTRKLGIVATGSPTGIDYGS